MTHAIKREAFVPHSQQQMFTLINAVESYPEFVPGCAKGEVLETQVDGVVAQLTFAAGGLTHSFTTKNTLHYYDCIELELVSGIFSHLKGKWRLHALETGGTHICLSLTFTLSQNWMNRLLEPLFVQLANQLVHVFCQRADTIYGQIPHKK